MGLPSCHGHRHIRGRTGLSIPASHLPLVSHQSLSHLVSQAVGPYCCRCHVLHQPHSRASCVMLKRGTYMSPEALNTEQKSKTRWKGPPLGNKVLDMTIMETSQPPAPVYQEATVRWGRHRKRPSQCNNGIWVQCRRMSLWKPRARMYDWASGKPGGMGTGS